MLMAQVLIHLICLFSNPFCVLSFRLEFKNQCLHSDNSYKKEMLLLFFRVICLPDVTELSPLSPSSPPVYLICVCALKRPGACVMSLPLMPMSVPRLGSGYSGGPQPCVVSTIPLLAPHSPPPHSRCSFTTQLLKHL